MNILLLNASPKNYGATQEILKILQAAIPAEHTSEIVCMGDYEIRYCKGCMGCYMTGYCSIRDGMDVLIDKLDEADVIVFAAPSYWADVPGICKSFIDRCTPFGDTNEFRERELEEGKRCYAVALRTGGRPMECEHIISTIKHWCGHMGIEMADSMYFTGIHDKRDILKEQEKILEKAREWFV